MHAWPLFISVAFVRVNGSLSLLGSHADREGLSLGPSGVLKGPSVLVSKEGIVSLSQLSQVAALNGRRIKATSLGKRVNAHIYRSAQTQHTFSYVHTRSHAQKQTHTYTHTHALPVS